MIIDDPNLDDQLVEDADIVDFPGGDNNHRRNVSVQIHEVQQTTMRS
jgi:hypothetical protein